MSCARAKLQLVGLATGSRHFTDQPPGFRLQAAIDVLRRFGLEKIIFGTFEQRTEQTHRLAITAIGEHFPRDFEFALGPMIGRQKDPFHDSVFVAFLDGVPSQWLRKAGVDQSGDERQEGQCQINQATAAVRLGSSAGRKQDQRAALCRVANRLAQPSHVRVWHPLLHRGSVVGETIVATTTCI